MKNFIAIGSQVFKIYRGEDPIKDYYVSSNMKVWLAKEKDIATYDIPDTWNKLEKRNGEVRYTTPVGLIIVIPNIDLELVEINGWTTMPAENIISFYRQRHYFATIPRFVQGLISLTKTYTEQYRNIQNANIRVRHESIQGLIDDSRPEAISLRKDIEQFDHSYTYSDDRNVWLHWSAKEKEIKKRQKDLGLKDYLSAYCAAVMRSPASDLSLKLQRWEKGQWLEILHSNGGLKVPSLWFISKGIDGQPAIYHGFEGLHFSTAIVYFNKVTGIATTKSGAKYLLDSRTHDHHAQANSKVSLSDAGISLVAVVSFN